MKRAFLILLVVFSLIFYFGCKPKPREIPPMPNMKSVETSLNAALDRTEGERDPQGLRDQKISLAKSELELCERALEEGKCDERTISKYCLMLGDFTFDADNYKESAGYFQQAILSRYEAFEKEEKQQQQNIKINDAERKKQGEKPNLLAGAAYLKARFALIAYQDYAEMVRAERRLATVLKAGNKQQEAMNALARASLGFKKAIQYRTTYEEQKRILLSLLDRLSAEYEVYTEHIASWDAQVGIPKI